MAIRMFLAVAILLLSLAAAAAAEVSSDFNIQQETPQVVMRSTKGRLLQQMGLLVSRYVYNGQSRVFAATPLLAPAPTPAVHLDCGGLCKHRCSLHSRPNLCNRACGTCCLRCKCVPPGTFGNREMCGKCYTDMTTHGNKTKCP